MRKILLLIAILAIVGYAETLFEVKDSANNKVFDVSTDGIAVMNLGDTLMVISTTEIKAVIDDSKALSRKFSVSTTSAKKGLYTDLFDVSLGSATMRESGGNRYTDFSPENIFLGLNTGIQTIPLNDTSGENNVFVGNESGFTNTSGASNVFIGYKSGYSNLTGYNNCFIGQESGYKNYNGRYNVFMGNSSGYNNYDGDFNVFLGYTAGWFNTSGSRNVFIGYEAGMGNSTGWGNTFIGEASGGANTEGYGNSYFGRNSGFSNTTGDYNTVMGHDVNTANQSGNYNSCFGAESGKWNYSSGSSNSLFGYRAGYGTAVSSNTYSNNSYFGSQSGYSTTTGSNNTNLGYQAGYSNATGTGNVFLGNQAGYSETGSYKLYIDNSTTASPLIYGDFDADLVKINGDFDVKFLATVAGLDVNGDAGVDGTLTAGKINTTAAGDNYLRITSTSPTISGIELFRTGASYRDWRIYNTGGNLKFGYSADELSTATDIFQILYTGYVGIGSTTPSQKLDVYGGNGRVETGYSWLTSSDKRFKKNITTLENPLSNLRKMRGVRYDRNEDLDLIPNRGKHIGFIAQELEEVYSELVSTDEKGFKAVAYDKVSAVLVEAVKELDKSTNEEIEMLKKENQEIRKELEEIRLLLKSKE